MHLHTVEVGTESRFHAAAQGRVQRLAAAPFAMDSLFDIRASLVRALKTNDQQHTMNILVADFLLQSLYRGTQGGG